MRKVSSVERKVSSGECEESEIFKPCSSFDRKRIVRRSVGIARHEGNDVSESADGALPKDNSTCMATYEYEFSTSRLANANNIKVI